DTIISLTGDLLPSEAAEINTDSFVIKLDDNDITSTCEVTQENFSCSLENELDLGRHLVNVSVGDSSEQTATLEWTFSIVEAQTTDNSSTNNDSSTVVIFGREIPRSGVILLGIILCIGGALLLIPWILYSIWSGRDSDSSSSSDSGSDGTAIENNYDFSSTDYSVPSTTDLPSIDSYSDSSTSTSSDYSSIPSYDPNTSYDINSAGTDYSYTPPSSDSNSYTDYTVGNSSSTESTQPETASVMPEMPSLDSSATNSTNTEGNQNSSDNFVEPQQTS
ncbi:hypothetical protein KC678_00505, partial [Candidatus Dojkabacteria bacterium]|nr:hypothetical protein [Candidatus Dojkabacteria bacterium]